MTGELDEAMRERAEFWTTRDPSTIGYLYDPSAVRFAEEVLALLDRVEAAEARAKENGYQALAAEAEAEQWKRTCVTWSEEYAKAWNEGHEVGLAAGRRAALDGARDDGRGGGA